MGVSNRRDNSGGEGRVGISNEQLSVALGAKRLINRG